LISLVLVAFWLCDRKVAIGMALILLFSVLLNYGLKAAFSMPRPPENLHKVTETGFGMPSGHAQASGTFYTSAAYANGKGWMSVLAAAMIVLVSLSRVYLGVHYPGDVVAGALVGVVFAVVMMMVWERHVPAIDDRAVRKGSLILALPLAALVAIFVWFGSQSATIPGVMLGLCIGFLIPGASRISQVRDIRQTCARVLVGSAFLVPLMALMLLLPGLSIAFAIALGAISAWLVPRMIFMIEKKKGKGARE
jgi:acid phosphatase family membrane protein YuiD